MRTLLVSLLALGACAPAPPPAAEAPVPEPRLLTDNGGRVAWYAGARHELIAFDAVTDERTRATAVYTMAPDGSGRRCVTCAAGLPKGFVGQPAWHPDGERLVVQVENASSEHRFYNHMSWGIDNDLWLVSRAGSRAQRIHATPRRHAALHPHFDRTGTLLVFAERVPTGRKLRGLIARQLTPDGENHWDGWQIRLARFDPASGRLSEHRALRPNGGGFYETHGFTAHGRIVYSHTAAGKPYVDGIYTAAPDGSEVRAEVDSDATWDEHGQFSRRGDFAFISSRVDPALRFPGTRAAELRTELYLRRGGAIRQLTDMNRRKGRRVAVSDFDWDRDGRRIVFQVAVIDGSARPEIWLIGF